MIMMLECNLELFQLSAFAYKCQQKYLQETRIHGVALRLQDTHLTLYTILGICGQE